MPARAHQTGRADVAAPLPAAGPLVFVAAHEPSGDAHAASLIRAVRSQSPEVRFAGVAGPAMQAEGCWPIFDMSRHSAMLLGVVRAVPAALKLLASTSRHLRRYPFSAAVVVDSPTLNLPIALRAKRAGLPVLYFIAPQLWAWGESRMNRLRARVDRMAVILPFEEAYFQAQGIDARYVGHPLFDRLAAHPPDPALVASIRAKGQPVVAVLPGSRRHVVEEVFGGQLEVLRQIVRAFPKTHIAVSVANAQVAGPIRSAIRRSGLSVSTLDREHNGEMLTAADLTLVASGTATLEVAYRGCPMIVMYNASRLAYELVGRWMIKTRHLCLVNILAQRELVPEFMPYYRSTEPIAEQAVALLGDEQARRRMSEALSGLIEPVIKPGAAENVAEMLINLLE
ncbi:MAG: lipid-A-disaccharide synthase [Phycisphaerae bacterium]